MAQANMGSDYLGGFEGLIDTMETMLTEATMTSGKVGRAYFVQGNVTFELRGAHLSYDIVDGERVLTGGSVERIVVRQSGEKIFTLSQLGVDAADMMLAAADDAAGQRGRIEGFLSALDWVYVGNGEADVLSDSTTSSDGVALDMSGNDRIYLQGGDDSFHFGAGHDRGWGGTGDDYLDGGAGNDRIWGENGMDLLQGGTGNDYLDGGKGDDFIGGGDGRDTLRGGAGADSLTGGADRDLLIGGAGADVFTFFTGDGRDTIRDFEVGVDRLEFVTDRAIEITDTWAGARISYGDDSVLLLGVAAAELGAGDFL
jgi:Ca2+-binding RTX toxin-like protein